MSIYSGFVYERFLGMRQGGVDCNCETRAQGGDSSNRESRRESVNPSKRPVDDSAPVFLMGKLVGFKLH